MTDVVSVIIRKDGQVRTAPCQRGFLERDSWRRVIWVIIPWSGPAGNTGWTRRRRDRRGERAVPRTGIVRDDRGGSDCSKRFHPSRRLSGSPGAMLPRGCPTTQWTYGLLPRRWGFEAPLLPGVLPAGVLDG
ncbi:MAG TPA: hypothetical protein VNG12_02050, partial [Acidimicrobiales bacterium]|nr:hypothetical protein [Acidimicrobiales bacterium]